MAMTLSDRAPKTGTLDAPWALLDVLLSGKHSMPLAELPGHSS